MEKEKDRVYGTPTNPRAPSSQDDPLHNNLDMPGRKRLTRSDGVRASAPVEELSLTRRMLSAAAGGILTSLMMTPLVPFFFPDFFLFPLFEPNSPECLSTVNDAFFPG